MFCRHFCRRVFKFTRRSKLGDRAMQPDILANKGTNAVYAMTIRMWDFINRWKYLPLIKSVFTVHDKVSQRSCDNLPNYHVIWRKLSATSL
jgi:hypothetical protein